MDFKRELEKRVKDVEAVIGKYLPQEEGFQKTVIEAMNYSILAGGKRIRPILILETYALLGGTNVAYIEPFLAAMEMIHTYSLVHDDLPAMDDDEYRRGRKTTHVVYGEAMGILAGDGLLNYAYETASKAFFTGGDIQLAARAFAILAEKAGIYGMVGGQAVDVENCDRPMELNKLNFIYELKTGALIEASMLIGAVMAGAEESQLKTVAQIARKVGLAFQIQDDILDVIGDEAQIGKPLNSDEKNHKTTYVTIYGVEQAKQLVEELSKDAIGLLHQLQPEHTFLEELIRFLINREK